MGPFKVLAMILSYPLFRVYNSTCYKRLSGNEMFMFNYIFKDYMGSYKCQMLCIFIIIKFH